MNLQTETEPAPALRAVSFLRHAGWVGPEDFTDTLNIIGCGAVGSNIAVTAARMGWQRFKIWDSDIVEPHNLANQAFDVEHIGLSKTEALKKVLQRFNPNIQVETVNRFFTKAEDSDVEGPIVIATDSMSSRAEIYDVFYLNTSIDYVFECRLGFDYGEFNIVDNMNTLECTNWKSTLRKDSEVPEGPCNKRICTTLVGLVSNCAVHNLCARYAAHRHDTQWDYKSKTMFNLTPVLNVFHM